MNSLDSASDLAGTNSLLYGNRGGFGFGGEGLAAGNSVLAANSHADGTGTGNNVKNLAELTRFGFDSNQEQIRETRTIDQFNGLRDNQFRAELRGADQLAALSKEVNDNARVMDKCCCETKEAIAEAAKDAAKTASEAQLRSAENQAATLAAITANQAVALAIEGRAIERSLNAANAELTSLKTQIACGCSSPS